MPTLMNKTNNFEVILLSVVNGFLPAEARAKMKVKRSWTNPVEESGVVYTERKSTQPFNARHK